ncbi:MAG: carboxylesterase family protein [Planctomycetota bacterium]
MSRLKTESSPGQYAQTFEKTITKNIGCSYWLFLPEGYGRDKRLWPTILFLHGAAERGDDLEKVKTWGLPKVVDKRKDFPFIVISPQCPDGDIWLHHIDGLISLLDDIQSRYSVDPQRIYLTGLSMGGFGTWDLACRYPERFAAIAPFCGYTLLEKACKLKDMPVWAFHGAKDELVPVKDTENMIKAIEACGGKPRVTIYPDLGHVCWVDVLDGDALYDWFIEHRKE